MLIRRNVYAERAVCDNANENCPVFPGRTERIHWGFEDPAAVEGDEEARVAVFHRVWDEIREQLDGFIHEQHAGSAACVWASEPASVGFISIDIATERLPQRIGYEPMRFLPRNSLPNIRDLILSVERSVEPLRKQEALAEIVEALRACSAFDSDELHVATPRRVIVNRAREYLASRIQSNPSLDEVSRAVEANKFVLIRYVRRELGVTPHAWLVRTRVERARGLLARGVASSEVADATGFADQAHLGRVFKRIVGLTPSEYARRPVR